MQASDCWVLEDPIAMFHPKQNLNSEIQMFKPANTLNFFLIFPSSGLFQTGNLLEEERLYQLSPAVQ